MADNHPPSSPCPATAAAAAGYVQTMIDALENEGAELAVAHNGERLQPSTRCCPVHSDQACWTTLKKAIEKSTSGTKPSHGGGGFLALSGSVSQYQYTG